MTTISIIELPPEAQDLLRKTVNEYYVAVDPITQERYVRFMGENVSLQSIQRSHMLLG